MNVGSRTVCNIGPRQRRRRLVVGVTAVAGTVVLGWVLIAAGVPRVWRLAVFLPAFVAALAVFQVRAGTCVVLAARGLQNMDDGEEAMSDPAALHAVKAQARRVNAQALLVAGAVAAAVAVFTSP